MQIDFHCNYILSFQSYFQENAFFFQICFLEQADFEMMWSFNAYMYTSCTAFKLDVVG